MPDNQPPVDQTLTTPAPEIPPPEAPVPEVPVTEPPAIEPPIQEPPVANPPEVDPPHTEPLPASEPPVAASAVAVSPAAVSVPEMSPAACAARLAELFPAVFTTGAPKPLKLRIQADVQQRAPGLFTRRVLSGFLQRYTTGTAYLKALAQLPERVDLDGAPAGPVSEEHRQAAVDEVARRRGLHDARRAAERDAQRQAQREAQRAAQDEARREHQARTADDTARRDRAMLLRAFETSTLTKANFCVLKRITEPELDSVLTQARTEREQRPPPAPRAEMRPDPRLDQRPQRPAHRPDHSPQRPDHRPDQRMQRPDARPPGPDQPPEPRAPRPVGAHPERRAEGGPGQAAPRQHERRPAGTPRPPRTAPPPKSVP